MKLNEQSKNELRKEIEEAVKRVPEGQRIHLDKELLDELLFITLTVNKEKGIIIKFPVWSGKFLSKIDLSEISFENVTWSYLDYELDILNENLEDDKKIAVDKSFIKLYSSLIKNCPVDYSNTNAKIDLLKSFEYLVMGFINIRNCNLRNVDLSFNNLDKVKMIYLSDSNIGNSNLKIPNDISFVFEKSNLDNLDLSNFNILAENILYGVPCKCYIFLCSLVNTGINIDFSNLLDYLDKKYSERIGKKDIINKRLSELNDYFNKELVGCYANGKLIKSNGQKHTEAFLLKDKYESIKKDIFESTIGSIEEQIKGFKSK